LSWLLIPLCGLCLITSAMAYNMAAGFANDAYDGQLANTAAAVAARLRFDGVKVWLDLPPAAQAVLRHNTDDKLYYQVVSLDGTRIAGDAILPKPVRNLHSDTPVFKYAELDSKKIRIARIRVIPPYAYDRPVLVQVAETLNARSALTNRILSAIVIPQIALILLGAAAVSAGVSKGLTPLRRLERALSKRSKLDLKPVETSNVPEEVYPLVIAINDLLDRLKKDIESQERFVANAAHQFRTPIAGLKTYVGLAERIIKDEKVSPIMSQLNSGCDRLTNLVNKMLSLAKVEPNFVTTNKTLLDLNEIASRATSDLVAEALEKDIDLSFKNSSDQALINGNETGLMDMVVNLVENAVHYTQKGGKVSVSVTANEAVTLLVEDNGPGIPIEERERVFERFYRILGNEASGSGLGLSIVKEIALAHNATITLEEGSAGGTLVRVTFERMKKGS